MNRGRLTFRLVTRFPQTLSIEPEGSPRRRISVARKRGYRVGFNCGRL
jgi:hypothetical protein